MTVIIVSGEKNVGEALKVINKYKNKKKVANSFFLRNFVCSKVATHVAIIELINIYTTLIINKIQKYK